MLYNIPRNTYAFKYFICTVLGKRELSAWEEYSFSPFPPHTKPYQKERYTKPYQGSEKQPRHFF